MKNESEMPLPSTKDSVDGCQCFTCTHKDPKERIAYYTGYIEACDWFLCWACRNNIPSGSISSDDLPGIVAQIECNRDETKIILDEILNS